MALTFTQADRLKTPPQFDAVFGLKKSASDGVLVVFAGPNAVGRPRLGLSVSRKVGNAPVRNRWKRLLREAFRAAGLPACDYVVVPRRLPAPPSQAVVRASLMNLARDAARRVQKASGGRQAPVPATGNNTPPAGDRDGGLTPLARPEPPP